MTILAGPLSGLELVRLLVLGLLAVGQNSGRLDYIAWIIGLFLLGRSQLHDARHDQLRAHRPCFTTSGRRMKSSFESAVIGAPIGTPSGVSS
jgi:hypothetical protein